MDTPRKFNFIDLYFDLSGEIEDKSTRKLYPQGNYQSVIYANFRTADPANVMGIQFELANGQTIDERPMYYIGKKINDGIEYHSWEFVLPDVIATTFRKDREVPLLIQFTEREISAFIGVFDEPADLPTSTAEEGDYAWVLSNEKVYGYVDTGDGTLEWEIQSDLETYGQVFGSDLISVTVARSLRVQRETVDIDTAELVLKALARTQADTLKKDGNNADDDIDINGVTFNYNRNTDAIQGSEYDARVTSVNTSLGNRVLKSGDTMTGTLTFTPSNSTRLNLNNNDITMDGNATINDTSFGQGTFTSDAVRYAELANIFDVGVGSGSPSFTSSLKTNITEKFDEYIKSIEVDTTWLRRDGEFPMIDDLNMGGFSLTNVDQVDGIDVSQLSGTVSSNTSAISGKVDKTTTIAGINLQDNITLEELKTNIGNAIYVEEGSQLDGLMSSEDKKNLDNLVAKLGLTEDGDEVVNTLNEIIAVFNQYPEQTELATRLTTIENALTPTAEENVQSNWEEDDTNSDAHILNKPSIFEQGELSPQKDDPENSGTDIPDFDTLGVLDERYYTEKELDPSAEVDANVLDARYYTESELNDGQLDNRYYTEDELNAGQLDDRYYTEGQVDALLADKVDLEDLQTTLTLYPTTTYEVGGDFDDYAQMVINTSDSRYDDTFVELYTTDDRTSTGTSEITSTDSSQPNVVGRLIADVDVIDKISANTSISTIGQVKKHSGNNNENPRLRFRLFKSSDLVNDIGESGYTDLINNDDYENIFENLVVTNEVTFAPGERLVILYEAYTTQGSPIVAIKFGGNDPVRTIVPQTFDATFSASNIIYDDTDNVEVLGGNVKDALDAIESAFSDYAKTDDIPTNNNELTNGAGYITDYTVTSDDVTTHQADLTIAQSQVTNLTNDLNAKADLVEVTQGVFKVPASQLPSYVDDVIEGYYNTPDGLFYTDAGFTTGNEITGETGKVYVDLANGADIYRWSGSVFTRIVEAVAFGTIEGTAYEGDDGKANADAIEDLLDGTTTAKKAQQDASGNVITTTYATKNELSNYSVANIGDIDNVVITTGELDTKNYLKFDPNEGESGAWVNVELDAPVIDSLDAIAGVNATNPTQGDFLRWDANEGESGAWVLDRNIEISDTLPTNAKIGDLWFDSSSLILYIYYNDGTDEPQWVNAAGGVLEEQVEAMNDLNDVDVASATDGQVIAYNEGNQTWEATTPSSANYYSVTIATGDWSGTDPSTAVKTVSGVLSTDKPLIDVDLSSVAFGDIETTQTEYAKLYRVAATANDEITFYALEAPTENLTIQIKVVR